jgi:hypothetical protein
LTAREIAYIKKDIGKLINKEEFIVRLNVLNSEINTKLEQRPTNAYFKTVLKAYDLKIE